MRRRRTPAKPPPQIEGASRVPTAIQTMKYACDMLISLRKIIALHNETQLLRLIDAAAEEARKLVEKEPT